MHLPRLHISSCTSARYKGSFWVCHKQGGEPPGLLSSRPLDHATHHDTVDKAGAAHDGPGVQVCPDDVQMQGHVLEVIRLHTQSSTLPAPLCSDLLLFWFYSIAVLIQKLPATMFKPCNTSEHCSCRYRLLPSLYPLLRILVV